MQSGEYADSNIFTHIGHEYWELEGKTVGIIGFGNIGQRVAGIANAFGARVIYYSTSGNNLEQSYDSVTLEDLLKQSDVVSIHAPLNANTKGLIGYSQLALMKSSAIMLNLGRGGIVQEADLVKALNQERIYGAVLDVLENEPIRKDSVLNQVNDNRRLLITPHIAWASKEARQQLITLTLKNIDAYLEK